MSSSPRQGKEQRSQQPVDPTHPAASRQVTQATNGPRARRAAVVHAPGRSPTPLSNTHAGATTHNAAPAPAAGFTAIAAALPAGWVLIPLRLFLGITFVYAGLQKLTDPQFFNPQAVGYIGRQIQAFAHGSPISGLLLTVALPHAAFYGGLIAYGELAIGLGTLIGLLARPAATFGLLLSLIFFLSASWNVHPYFYGADIVFIFAWLTLGFQPHAGLPSLDTRVAAWLGQRQPLLVTEHPITLALLFSIPEAPAITLASLGARPAPQAVEARGHGRHAGRSSARLPSRRQFLTGLGAGVVGTLGLVWVWNALHPAPATPAPGGSGDTALPTETSGATPAGTAATGTNIIARTTDVPANSATSFTLPSNGDPGVLVHLNDGRFVAFDATCTHAGCPVQYDPGSQDLYCPCHGAVFDPAHDAAVLQGPADTPLTAVSVTVQGNGDIVVN